MLLQAAPDPDPGLTATGGTLLVNILKMVSTVYRAHTFLQNQVHFRSVQYG